MKTTQLQVLLCSGPEQEDRAVLALAMALSAAHSQTEVTIFLMNSGVAWADELFGNEIMMPGFETIGMYWNMLLEKNVRIEACTTCLENHKNRHGGTVSWRKGFYFAGLSTAAMRSSEMNTLVF